MIFLSAKYKQLYHINYISFLLGFLFSFDLYVWKETNKLYARANQQQQYKKKNNEIV